MTQKQLAGDLGIPVSTLGGYVQGTSEPDFHILVIIAEYFHVTTDYLLGRHDSHTMNECEDDLLRIFRSLPPVQQALYLEQGRAFVKVNARAETKAQGSDPGARHGD